MPGLDEQRRRPDSSSELNGDLIPANTGCIHDSSPNGVALVTVNTISGRMLRKQSERDERELGLMIKCLGWLRPVVLTVRGALMSAANLLTTGVLPASPGQWAAGALGYQPSGTHQNMIKEKSIWSS
ncbi:hypothetical protein SRHO_G00004350 [Serrasalmus rhombeus]